MWGRGGVERRQRDRRRAGTNNRGWQDQIVFFLMMGAILYGLWWYVTVYDSAQGRCQRGDVGACVVVVANQLQPTP